VKPAAETLGLPQQRDVRVGARLRCAERDQAAGHARPNDGEVRVSSSPRHDVGALPIGPTQHAWPKCEKACARPFVPQELS